MAATTSSSGPLTRRPANLADASSAYVVYGKADSSAQSIDGGAYGGYRIDGSSAGAALGSSVSIVGDTGGEEHADVAVGAPGDNSANPATAATRTHAGTVYIVRGACTLLRGPKAGML